MRSFRILILSAAAFIPLSSALADVTISNAPTQNISCSSGVCGPTAMDAVLNSNDLQKMLAAGNVSISTTGSGVQANNIVIASKFAWKASYDLTLDAYDSITVNAPVTVKGKASVTVQTNDGGTGGVFVFGPQGRMDIRNLATSLVINGASFVLVSSVSSLASAIRANPSGSFALADNYDASNDGTYIGAPVPTWLNGEVQGLGNTISNLSVYYAKKKDVVGGVFMLISDTGSVQNLRLVNEKPSIGNRAQWGGLVGQNNGLLFNDSVTGTFKTKCSGCGFSGLVTTNYNQAILSSSNVTILSLRGFGAGLAGGNTGEIFASHTQGSVSGKVAGGIVAYNIGHVVQSYSSARIEGGDGAVLGGLVGDETTGDTTDSYATGTVSGGSGSTVGGLIGETDNPTSTSYAIGAVSGGESSLVGGFIGQETATSVENCYWDTDTSGTDEGTGEGNVSGLTGLTTEQLQSGLPAGFDPNIWAEDPNINNGFPYLIANPPPTKSH
ncbi:MAG TPA: hypothetical protein VGK90_06005 [Rhizomicrobium sp.]|jgi:hypothetical protein